eukprot:4095561-Amphidinium_carterae.1
MARGRARAYVTVFAVFAVMVNLCTPAWHPCQCFAGVCVPQHRLSMSAGSSAWPASGSAAMHSTANYVALLQEWSQQAVQYPACDRTDPYDPRFQVNVSVEHFPEVHVQGEKKRTKKAAQNDAAK